MLGELIRHFADTGGPGLAAGAALLAAYLMPLVIAATREHRYTRMIGAINLVLGWTVIGWFAALFWAVNRDLREQPPAEAAPSLLRDPPLRDPPLHEPTQSLEPVWIDPEAVPVTQHNSATRICPHCAEAVKAEAVVCRYCARDLAPAPEHTLPAARLDERGMRELYDLLQEMERETAQVIQDANLQDLPHHSGHPGSDSIRTGDGRLEAIPAGAGRIETIPAGESRLETFKAERFRPDEISTDEIVNSRDAGITASGRQSSRIKKAS